MSRRGRRGRGEREMVPAAEFQSYYGKPVLNQIVWKWDIPAYLFAGGLAAGSSLLAAGAGRRSSGSGPWGSGPWGSGPWGSGPWGSGSWGLCRSGRLSALVGISASLGFLVHDLGRPARFLNMLRVARPTSPMSMGSWIVMAYSPAAGVAGAAEAAALLRRAPWPLGSVVRGPVGRLLQTLAGPAGWLAALAAPAVASYTAVLVSDTAVPAWHDAYPQLPWVFVGSAATAAGGLGMLTAPGELTPARRMAVGGGVLDLGASAWMERRMGLSGEPYRQGRAGALMRAARWLTVGGVLASLLARRSRLAGAAGGVALLAGSLATRFAVFHAGKQSAADPKYVVVPQRERRAAATESG